jgi:hypothetical protein
MQSLPYTSPFDSIRHEDDQGEYWLATELLTLFGYKTWKRQRETVERAATSCQNSGGSTHAHFVEVVQMAQIGDSQAFRSVIKDYRLSRLGCYLTAMNGDPRKPEIASAQSYFAVKTREAEVVTPQQSERIRELELQLAIAQANATTTTNQRVLFERSEAIVVMHGALTLALIQGRPDAVVTEKEVVQKTVMVDQNLNPVATFDGMGIGEIARKLGFTGKNANQQCKRWLVSVGIKDNDWVQEMTAHATAKLPRERMGELKRLWMQRKGDRQMLLGE